MAIYRFVIHNGGSSHDEKRTELPDDETALTKALQIILDLKLRRGDIEWKSWTMEVSRNGRQLWRIPFDETGQNVAH